MDKPVTSESSRADGLRLEATLIKWMVKNPQLFHRVVTAKAYENITRDIDVWVITKTQQWVPMSIKVNEPQYYEAPMLLELRQAFYPKNKDGTYDYNGEPNVIDSWFYRGKAEYYLVWKRRTKTKGDVWLVNKQQLLSYVDEHGFDKVTTQRKEVQDREREDGKAFTELGLIDLKKLREHGVARLIGYVQ